MILIQRYIFKELVYNFLFTFVVVTVIMLLVLSVQVIFKYPAVGFYMLFKYLPIMLAGALTIVIPAAVLVSSVMTYGRIASDNEILTMRASGIHVMRIVVPGIFFGLLASFVLLVINDRVVPVARYQARSITDTIDFSRLLDVALKQGEKMVEVRDWVLTWEDAKKEDRTGQGDSSNSIEDWVFSGIRGKNYDDDGSLKTEVLAQAGRIKERPEGGYVFQLLNAKVTQGLPISGESFNIPLPLGDERSIRRPTVRPVMRTLAALAAIKGRSIKVYDVHEVDAELNKRISDSLSPLIFVLLSIPVAILFKQQNRMVAFLIAILLALFVYYPVTLLADTFAKQGTLDPLLSIWPVNLVLSVLGFLFILKVMRR